MKTQAKLKKSIIELIDEAVNSGARTKKACQIIGVSLRTFQRWNKNNDHEDKRKGPKNKPGHTLTHEEKNNIIKVACAPENRELSPAQIVPKLADQGIYIVSESSFYRVLKENEMSNHRENCKPPKKRHKPAELIAYGPNEVWTWDITLLPSNIKGKFYYLYLILDLYSRYIVGWEIHEVENSDHASNLILKTTFKHGVEKNTLTLHSDNGSPMKGSTMLSTLEALGIAKSFSRPSVSNDNPYSESLFRTLKYRPQYPKKPFESINASIEWLTEFVNWYNNIHLHSNIKFVTPFSRYYELDKNILQKRKITYENAKALRPDRWSGNSRNWEHINSVKLNPDNAKKDLETKNILAA